MSNDSGFSKSLGAGHHVSGGLGSGSVGGGLGAATQSAHGFVKPNMAHGNLRELHFLNTVEFRHRLKSYVPVNPDLYNAALTGFLAGVFQTTVLGPSTPPGIVQQAQVFAQAVDQAIPAGTSTIAKTELLSGLCQANTAYRFATGHPQSDYTSAAASVAAIFNSAAAVLAASSIVPVPGTPTTPLYEAGGFTANANTDQTYLVDTTAGAIASLAAPTVDGVHYTYVDYASNFGTHALTITPLGGTTIGDLPPNTNVQGASTSLATNGDSVTYEYSKKLNAMFLI